MAANAAANGSSRMSASRFIHAQLPATEVRKRRVEGAEPITGRSSRTGIPIPRGVFQNKGRFWMHNPKQEAEGSDRPGPSDIWRTWLITGSRAHPIDRRR